MKTTSKSLFKMALGRNRESAKQQGFFDGRFRQRAVENKKRKQQLKDGRTKYRTSDF